MTRRGWIVTGALLALPLAALLAVAALLATERGLTLVLHMAQRFAPGDLDWVAAEGRLIGPLSLAGLEYTDANGSYRIGRLAFEWSPGRLLARRLSVHRLHIEDIDITLAEAAGDAPAAPIEPGWTLPVELVLRDVRVHNLRVRSGVGDPLVIGEFTTALSSGLEWVDIDHLHLRLDPAEIDVSGRLGLGRQVATDLALDWRAAFPGYAPMAAQGRLSGTWERAQLTQRFSAPLAAQAQLDVREPFADLHWALDLTLPAAALAQIRADWPAVRIGGKLQASGTLQTYRLALDARVAGADIPDADVQAEGRGDRASLRVDRLRIATLDGEVRGQGDLAWAPRLRWDAQLSAENLDPGRRWPDWPGRLSTRVRSSGADSDQGLDLNAVIEELAGTLRGYPVAGSGSFARQGGTLRIENLQLNSGDARVEANGSVAAQWALDWRLSAPRLEQLLPGYAGALEANGSIDGARAQPRILAEARARDLAVAALRLAELQADADLSLHAGAPLTLTAHGRELRLAERDFATLEVTLAGTLDAHALALQAQGAAHALDLAARGGWDGTTWSGRLERGDWRLPETGAWSLDAPASLTLAAQTGRSEETCWRQDAASLCAALEYAAGNRRFRARLDDWPVGALAAQHLPPGVSIAAQLGADLDARLPAQGAAQAQARVRLSSGTLDWRELNQARRTAFGGGDAEVDLDAAGARARAELRLGGTDRLVLEARLPGYRSGVAAAEQPLTGRLQGSVQDLALVDGLLDAVDQISGALHLDAALGGTLASPEIDGELRLADARAFIGPAGAQLEDVQLTLSGDPLAGRLELAGTARSGPGTARLDGWVTQLGSPDLAGELHIGGEGFEAVNLPEARVLVTPDVRAAVRARAVEVTGRVHIPEARIEPRDVSGAVTPSKDVVLVHQETEPPPGWEVRSRVQLTLGEKVQIAGFGLKGRLTGGIELIDEPGRVTRARGELAVQDGVYTAYGQELTIEQGRVLYRDGPLDNPGLDIRATRKSGDVTAGVRVLGSAQNPQAELYSQPSLPQADQLSYLLLGRPVAGASGGEGQMLAQAATSLGLKGGNQLAQSIGSRLGLDEFSVGGGNDLDSAALTVGKYLSPRLYLNYSVGLLDAANRLRIRYQLTPHLSVQTETGVETGGDILYTIER